MHIVTTLMGNYIDLLYWNHEVRFLELACMFVDYVLYVCNLSVYLLVYKTKNSCSLWRVSHRLPCGIILPVFMPTSQRLMMPHSHTAVCATTSPQLCATGLPPSLNYTFPGCFDSNTVTNNMLKPLYLPSDVTAGHTLQLGWESKKIKQLPSNSFTSVWALDLRVLRKHLWNSENLVNSRLQV